MRLEAALSGILFLGDYLELPGGAAARAAVSDRHYNTYRDYNGIFFDTLKWSFSRIQKSGVFLESNKVEFSRAQKSGVFRAHLGSGNPARIDLVSKKWTFHREYIFGDLRNLGVFWR